MQMGSMLFRNCFGLSGSDKGHGLGEISKLPSSYHIFRPQHDADNIIFTAATIL